MVVYIIQACLFILGAIPFLCEISKHFNDSLLTMFSRFFIFLITLICGWYAPELATLPNVFLFIITTGLLYFSYTTISDIVKVYHERYLLKR